MDRISALRNVEDALAEFEDGDATLEDVEDRVLGVLRTYATEFEDGDAAAYRATGDPAVEGTVVVAESREAAERLVAERADGVGEFGVERLD
jgi:stress response protein YsnF